MFCSNCGNKIADGARFCKQCGYKIEPPVSQEPSVPAEEITEMVAPATPTENVAPAATVEPAAPAAPVEPAAPIAPETPVAPAEPTAPTSPVAPVAPVEPVAPVAPETPAAPTAPVVPDGNPVKKSHKGLIISLISAGGVILAAVVTVLVFFFMYKGDVSDFEQLAEDYYIPVRAEYSQLLNEAQDAESIFSIFGYSDMQEKMTAMTDTIISENKVMAENLPDKMEELNNIKDRYLTDGFEQSIKAVSTAYDMSHGTEKYREIGECFVQTDKLIKDITDYNVRYAEDTINRYNSIIGTEGYEIAGPYAEEYEAYLDGLYMFADNDDYADFPANMNTLDDLLEKIRELNEKLSTYIEMKKGIDDTLSTLYISEENAALREQINQRLDAAFTANDVNAIGEETMNLNNLMNDVSDETFEILDDLREKVYGYGDTATIENEDYYDYLMSGDDSYSEGNYGKAIEAYMAADVVAIKELSSYLYELNIAQFDMTDFPMVNVYAYIKDFTTGEVLDELDPMGFTLKEAISGKGGYKDVDILKAARLDGVSNINMGIVADCSASMGGDFVYAKEAMKNLVGSLQTGVGDEAAVYAFSDTVERAYHYSSDKSALKNAISNMQMGNMTALYDALAFSLSEITVQSGAKCVVAFTDGQENYSYSSKDYVITKAQEFNVPIYIIGIGSGVNGWDLEDIATRTGGFYTNIYSINDMSDIYDRIYREQKAMYLLQYESEADTDNLEHDVIVSYEDESISLENTREYTPSQFKISGFVFYDSDRRYLTEEELDRLTEAEIRIAINEIYARCGYKFNLKQDMVDHFNALPWYHGTETDMDKVAKTFNEYEEYNVRLLVNYECQHGLNGRLDNKI